MIKVLIVLFLALPLFSERIYFTADLDGNWDIFSMNRSGKDITQITKTIYDEKDIKLSEDKTKLLYACSDGTIRVMDLKSSKVIDSVFTKDRNIKFHPSFYDGGIIYSTLTDFERDIFSVAEKKGNRSRLLLELRSSVFHPVNFNDSEFLFTYQHCSIGCQGYITELWMYNPDKRPTCRQLTLYGAHVIDPFKANDSTVFYAANPRGSMDIYKININTLKSSPVIVTDYNDVSPLISSDENEILFIRKDKGKTSIVLKSLKTEKESFFTPLPCRYMNIAW